MSWNLGQLRVNGKQANVFGTRGSESCEDFSEVRTEGNKASREDNDGWHVCHQCAHS